MPLADNADSAVNKSERLVESAREQKALLVEFRDISAPFF